MGYNLNVTVVGTTDTITPTLTSMTAPSPNSFDVSSSTVSLASTLYGTFADDLSGVQSADVTYTSPSGRQSTFGTFSLQADGSPAYGLVIFNQYAEGGVWLPTVRVHDTAGNTSTYTNAQLLALGYNLGITISVIPRL